MNSHQVKCHLNCIATPSTATLNPTTLYLQVHPLSLHLKYHLNDFQDVRQNSLPRVHLLLKWLHMAGGLHCGQSDLVILQNLE